MVKKRKRKTKPKVVEPITYKFGSYTISEEVKNFLEAEVIDPIAYKKLLTYKLIKYQFFIKSDVLTLDIVVAVMNDTILIK